MVEREKGRKHCEIRKEERRESTISDVIEREILLDLLLIELVLGLEDLVVIVAIVLFKKE